MHLSPTRQKQTRGKKWANPGMAVEEHDVRHLNCSSASEPKLEKPGRGTESGICGPEDITSTKQCMTGTNHHIASVWITKKRDNVSSNPHQTLYTWLLAPINVIGWVKNKQTNKQKAQQGAAEKPHCARQEEQEQLICPWFMHDLCIPAVLVIRKILLVRLSLIPELFSVCRAPWNRWMLLVCKHHQTPSLDGWLIQLLLLTARRPRPCSPQGLPCILQGSTTGFWGKRKPL